MLVTLTAQAALCRTRDEVANEVVNRFHAAGAMYREDLQQVNEVNWPRFKAQLEVGRRTARRRCERVLRRLPKTRGICADLPAEFPH